MRGSAACVDRPKGVTPICDDPLWPRGSACRMSGGKASLRRNDTSPPGSGVWASALATYTVARAPMSETRYLLLGVTIRDSGRGTRRGEHLRVADTSPVWRRPGESKGVRGSRRLCEPALRIPLWAPWAAHTENQSANRRGVALRMFDWDFRMGCAQWLPRTYAAHAAVCRPPQ